MVAVYDIDLLSITKKIYISFTKHVQDIEKKISNLHQITIIDSYKFLSTSLNKLARRISTKIN